MRRRRTVRETSKSALRIRETAWLAYGEPPKGPMSDIDFDTHSPPVIGGGSERGEGKTQLETKSISDIGHFGGSPEASQAVSRLLIPDLDVSRAVRLRRTVFCS